MKRVSEQYPLSIPLISVKYESDQENFDGKHPDFQQVPMGITRIDQSINEDRSGMN